MADKLIQPTTVDAKKAARKLCDKELQQGYQPSGFYEYTDKEGNPTYWRFRMDHSDKEKRIRPLSFNGSKWELKEPNFPNGKKPLYRLHEIVNPPDETVWIVEGEKCADVLSKLGLQATTSGSATSAGTADWSSLEGRKVIVWPDNDETGRRYAKDVTKQLSQRNCNVQWVDISKLGWSVGSVGSDAVDWKLLYPKATKEEVEELPLINPESDDTPAPDSHQGNSFPQILGQITKNCELFHSPDRASYATVPINSHKETWLLESAGFKDWLSRRFYQTARTVLKSQLASDFILNRGRLGMTGMSTLFL